MSHLLTPELGMRGRARVLVRNPSGRVVAARLFKNIETQYGLNSIATWLTGGAGVLAPAAPSYLALGTMPANLLSAAQADMESVPLGWQALTNCAVAQSGAQAWHGADSLAMTSSSAATMTATTTPGTSAVAAIAGNVYFAAAHFRAATSVRNVSVNIAWYDNTGTLLSTSSGTAIADTNTGWTRAGITATAPASTAYAAVQAQVASAGSSEVHYVDGAQLAAAWDSAPYAWTAGGQSPTPATTDTTMFQERALTRAKIDTAYTQAALAVLLHTYQQTDPVGSFLEAGLFDAACSTITLGAEAHAGDTTLTLSGGAPAVVAGQPIFIASYPLGVPTAPGFSGASSAGGHLAQSTTYYYVVTATNDLGETTVGTEASYTTPASGTATNQITLTWTAVTRATGYKIYRSTSPGGELFLASVTGTNTYVDNSATVPSGSPPSADTSGGGGEYATVNAAAGGGAGSWTLSDSLLATGHPNGATVTVFNGNMWAHVLLTNVSKVGTQLLTLQWEILLVNE